MSHWGLPVLASFGLLVGVLPGLLRGSFEGLFLGAGCGCLPLVKVLKYRAMNTTAVPSLQGAWSKASLVFESCLDGVNSCAAQVYRYTAAGYVYAGERPSMKEPAQD